MKKIWFDMDGTIADFYGVENWLEYLLKEDSTPYEICKPLVNMSLLARYIHKAQAKGYEVGIISWGSKNSSNEFLNTVVNAKIHWLEKHMPSVTFNTIYIEHYGTNKHDKCGGGILFDDEFNNRAIWGTDAYEPNEIFTILKKLA